MTSTRLHLPTGLCFLALAVLSALSAGCAGNEACEEASQILCEKACDCAMSSCAIASDAGNLRYFGDVDECIRDYGNCNGEDLTDAEYKTCLGDADGAVCAEEGGNPIGVVLPESCEKY